MHQIETQCIWVLILNLSLTIDHLEQLLNFAELQFSHFYNVTKDNFLSNSLSWQQTKLKVNFNIYPNIYERPTTNLAVLETERTAVNKRRSCPCGLAFQWGQIGDKQTGLMLHSKKKKHHDKEIENARNGLPFYKRWSVRVSLIRGVLRMWKKSPRQKEEWEQESRC